jgi:hypothetical protein
MGVTLGCRCGAEVSGESEGSRQETLTLDCPSCGRGYMVTVTLFQPPDERDS